MYDPKVKQEALRLRIEEKKSIPEISRATGASKATLSLWLKSHPLSEDERRKRCSVNGSKSVGAYARRKRFKNNLPPPSDLYQVVVANELNSNQRGKISEASVLLRLLAHGFSVFGGVFDGEKSDWVVTNANTDRFVKIQVKTAHTSEYGLPVVSLTRSVGNRRQRYEKGDFDLLVAYDLYSDCTYVWSWSEITHLKKAVSVTPNALERWDKLKDLCK